MKRYNKLIITVLLIMLVGFAAVSTTLILNGTAVFGTNTDDFDVIFTKSVMDGVDVSATTISEDGRSITFSTRNLSIKDDTSVLNFVITNNSTQYDADVTMECVSEGENASEYYTIKNTIPEIIEAKRNAAGHIVVTLMKSSTETISERFTCTIKAVAVEKIDEGTVDSYAVGSVVALAGELFNVTSSTDDYVTMLAQYNLGSNYKQSVTKNYISFANYNGWEYTPGPKEIDIQSFDGNAKTYVNEYVLFLQEELGDMTISGNLMTLSELELLGCTINDDYTYSDGVTCANSKHAYWLANGQDWWTRSAFSGNYVWRVNGDGSLHNYSYNYYYSVRPVITISKSTLESLN